MTNEQKLRAMSTYELLVRLTPYTTRCIPSIIEGEKKVECLSPNCADCIDKWLSRKYKGSEFFSMKKWNETYGILKDSE